MKFYFQCFLLVSSFVVFVHATSYHTPARCLQLKSTGSCRRHHQRWFYDPSDKKCKGFTYSGCKGNNNRFRSEKRCQKVCLPGAPLRLVCSLPPPSDQCNSVSLVWSYDHETERCKPYGCGGVDPNHNRFRNCTDCMERCSGQEQRKAQKLCVKLSALASAKTKEHGITSSMGRTE
uniref:BPTI/Kunitz inhibitor domain-containing protein n=1 Tax=Amblyomma triste TaxID=251400 RepID=A0A023G1E4_AMBTT